MTRAPPVGAAQNNAVHFGRRVLSAGAAHSHPRLVHPARADPLHRAHYVTAPLREALAPRLVLRAPARQVVPHRLQALNGRRLFVDFRRRLAQVPDDGQLVVD